MTFELCVMKIKTKYYLLLEVYHFPLLHSFTYSGIVIN